MKRSILQTTLASASLVALLGLATPSLGGSCGAYSASQPVAKAKSDCAPCDTMTVSAPANDIVAVAQGAGSFKTLLAAAEAAGLVDALRGDGPLTVFAPTDEAFAKLPEGTVQNLLRPENRDKLRAILLYHVVPGNVKAADVVKLNEAPTVLGQKAAIKVRDGQVMVDHARVVNTDIAASNGTIHVIDSVIMPRTTVELAEAAGSFKTLLAAAEAAGLVELLNSGTFTILAPSDDAFAKLPSGAVEALLKPENRGLLINVLSYHLVPGNVDSEQVVGSERIMTAAGQALTVRTEGSGDNARVHIGNARVVATDLRALNGTIHVLDGVLLPSNVTAALARAASEAEHLSAAQ
ncbi:MAG: fasciclin domain-containing protein [Phycisphaeraceae bacterium]|nr:fasciclin domain-containing protein [Phycisphaeraceae bacterium]